LKRGFERGHGHRAFGLLSRSAGTESVIQKKPIGDESAYS
jgi:hypothetical protein